jgi:hypothetical protein
MGCVAHYSPCAFSRILDGISSALYYNSSSVSCAFDGFSSNVHDILDQIGQRQGIIGPGFSTSADDDKSSQNMVYFYVHY